MRAATVADGRIEVRDHPDPEPGFAQVLVRVHSAGLNGADLLQKKGAYPAPPGAPKDIPGLELAGEVVGHGPEATRFALGDRVMSVVGGGGQAELAVIHEREAMAIPANLDWPEAGGLPEVFTTAHDALFTQAGLRIGERLCVHGAAGGVGTAAVQLGMAAGARVVATVRNGETRPRVTALGATVIDPAETVDHGPYDVILELVGAPNMDANMSS
ncbi:MAG: alcohol dehydrogenase catalytic domain-containing protein, partial [Actinomycetota bacterium]|nr:alcohol dehydrogenase catalytic domain-containing protein [Actinomycetota bacterium]